MSDDARAQRIIDVLTEAFEDLMAADQPAFRRKFRAMAADPYAFYRGSAALFYADVADLDDPWADERTSRVWIQGDLHAGNYGTYMNSEGILVFDVNDYDEAYLGHFTWDLRRLAASVALLGWSKALPDDVLTRSIDTFLRSYLGHVRYYVENDDDPAWSLRLDSATGHVLGALRAAQESSRLSLLSGVTVVKNYDRKFRDDTSGVRRLGDDEYAEVSAAYERYLETIPEVKKLSSVSYELKDIVGKGGFGIGSAGLPAYNLLVEGHTQALENDVVLTMKQGAVPAPSRIADHPGARDYFHHQGHRTAVSQRALQAHAGPWLGWAELDGVGFVVAEYSPYEEDLDWGPVTETDEVLETLEQLGRATAKIHCVSDQDLDDSPLVEFQTEEAILEVTSGREDEVVEDIVGFGMDYARQVRADHRMFVDAFRDGRMPGLTPG